MCFKGWDTSTPPACSTNPAGEKEIPWQTQTMLISAFEYLYKNPVIVLPLGPFPVAETHGICSTGIGAFPFLTFFKGLRGVSWRLVAGSLTAGETFSSQLVALSELVAWEEETLCSDCPCASLL